MIERNVTLPGTDSLDGDAYRTWRGHRHVDFKAP